mmetsp:Transcript_2553/g.8116  ORF Transcript_2553/g.8116 Transcript_2553/m.8116 type:complete len:560 (+) Transcript_2553:48-1727(+)
MVARTAYYYAAHEEESTADANNAESNANSTHTQASVSARVHKQRAGHWPRRSSRGSHFRSPPYLYALSGSTCLASRRSGAPQPQRRDAACRRPPPPAASARRERARAPARATARRTPTTPIAPGPLLLLLLGEAGEAALHAVHALGENLHRGCVREAQTAGSAKRQARHHSEVFGPEQVVAQRHGASDGPAARWASAVEGGHRREDVEGTLRLGALDARHGAEPGHHVVALGAEVVDAAGGECAVRVLDGRHGRVLRDGAGARGVVALHLGHGLHGVGRAANVTQPEAGHGGALGEAVDSQRPVVHPGQRGEGHVRLVVRDELVNLVGQHRHVRVAPQHGRDALESRFGDDGARRVGRVAQNEQPAGGGDGRLQRRRLQAVPFVRPRLDNDGRDAAQLWDAQVGWPVGSRYQHLVPRVAQREHRLQDGLLGAVAAQHLLWGVLEPLACLEVAADGRPQLVRACEGRVLDHALVERLVRRRHHQGRRVEVRLAHRERQHRLALPLQLDGEVRDGDGGGRLHPSHRTRHPHPARPGRQRLPFGELAAELGEGGAELVHHVV